MPQYIHDEEAITLAQLLAMPKSDKTKRIEAHLLPAVIAVLKAQADKENRSLKNYVETVLIEHVKELKSKKR